MPRRDEFDAMSVHWPFDNTYARLPAGFFARVEPTSVPAPRLVALNEGLARHLGLDPGVLRSPEGIEALAGGRVPEGSEPIALAYAGHQFGQFVPQLGDGRALLLGEVVDRDGVRRDIQLKGSGPTPYSRGGDGRAALGPVLREYVVSEAMAALGIPTTRSLAAVLTGDRVIRESILPGAVLTRIAASHVRVGTFQYFAARGNLEGLRRLADYVLHRHFPEAAGAAHPMRAVLDGIIARQASLVARWLHVGFVHGVMNTDNMSVAGETIDYGPCAFIDAYDPAAVFSSIDRGGRYAYANQPAIAQWNLARLAECFIPLLADGEEAGLEQAKDAMAAFGPAFHEHLRAGMRRKLGFLNQEDEDLALAQDLLDRMAATKADFTLTWRALSRAAVSAQADVDLRRLFGDAEAYDVWAVRWRARLARNGVGPEEAAATMRAANPAIIPRNHRVEEAIEAAVERDDFRPFERLHAALARPYEDDPAQAAYAEAPANGGEGYVTFCGT
jgi:serine/tyrosine/threonine adenylyltransferase